MRFPQIFEEKIRPMFTSNLDLDKIYELLHTLEYSLTTLHVENFEDLSPDLRDGETLLRYGEWLRKQMLTWQRAEVVPPNWTYLSNPHISIPMIQCLNYLLFLEKKYISLLKHPEKKLKIKAARKLKNLKKDTGSTTESWFNDIETVVSEMLFDNKSNVLLNDVLKFVMNFYSERFIHVLQYKENDLQSCGKMPSETMASGLEQLAEGVAVTSVSAASAAASNGFSLPVSLPGAIKGTTQMFSGAKEIASSRESIWLSQWVYHKFTKVTDPCLCIDTLVSDAYKRLTNNLSAFLKNLSTLDSTNKLAFMLALSINMYHFISGENRSFINSLANIYSQFLASDSQGEDAKIIQWICERFTFRIIRDDVCDTIFDNIDSKLQNSIRKWTLNTSQNTSVSNMPSLQATFIAPSFFRENSLLMDEMLNSEGVSLNKPNIGKRVVARFRP